MAGRSIAAPDGAEVARLRRGFHGQLLLPGQGGYERARQVWNAMVDRRPALITRCTGPARRRRCRAWVQGGALLGDLDRATQPFGLATTAGNVSHTGVGGLTLGGGMGWLARRLGLACDNVARFEVVNADGELLHASESENPDLFWGPRGGAGTSGW
jgi:hypothetical protein